MRKSYLFQIFTIAAYTVSVIIFMAACHKNKVEDTGYANDHATTEQTFNDVQTISDQAAATSSATLGYKTTATTIGGCATVTRTSGKIVVDFGNSDCVCHDGRKRRGQIIVTYTGEYADVGSVHTITFDNYYQNDNKVTGTKTVTNIGPNSQGQPVFNVSVNGSVTLQSSGGTISTEWTRVRTWTAGYSTPTDMTDDTYQITGSGTLTRANGRVISETITAPLVVAYSCRWIEAGAITFSVATGQSRVLNYGDTPNCDDLATIKLGNGTVRNITLP
jgi:hypothetical protein